MDLHSGIVWHNGHKDELRIMPAERFVEGFDRGIFVSENKIECGKIWLGDIFLFLPFQKLLESILAADSSFLRFIASALRVRLMALLSDIAQLCSRKRIPSSQFLREIWFQPARA